MKKIFNKYNVQLKLCFAYFIGSLILSMILYYMIPVILNYPQGTYGTQFQYELEQSNYLLQILLISLCIFILLNVITFLKTHFLIKYNDLLNHPNKYSLKEINLVKAKLLSTPYYLFILNIVVCSIVLTIVHSITTHNLGITTLKLFILIISLITAYITVIFLYCTNIFKHILAKLPYDDTTSLHPDSLQKRFFFNIIPLILSSVLFTSLLGYTRVAKENGNSLYDTNNYKLFYLCSSNNFSSLDDLLEKSKTLSFNNTNDLFFVRLPDGTFLNSDGNTIRFSDFFIKYLDELSDQNNGRVYEYYGIDRQASTHKLNLNGEQLLVGIYFEVISFDSLKYFSLSFILIVIINLIMLALFAHSISNDILTISNSLTYIAENNVSQLGQKLPLISNDEIGALTVAFNKVQNMTIEHISQIQNKQDMLLEKERLASLGQLIGGISHNLKTPIMSISGAAEGLTDLINEYDSSVSDPEVTAQDHHEIANDMREWINKIHSYTAYMSDIITAVKGQAVNLSENEKEVFTIDELFKRVNILMKHEIKNASLILEVNLEVSKSTSLDGDVNSLVQVVNNLITNAIQSYNGVKGQIIELTAKKQDTNLIISVSDHGCGMPDDVKQKLFKSMITTKGKNGTGLGMFMSYSTIKGHFNGDITFESTVGKGTTFNLILPLPQS